MKLKILSVMILSVAMSLPLANNAQAEVAAETIGLGYQGMFAGNIMQGASGRYWLNDNIGLEGNLFHMYFEGDTPAPGASGSIHIVSFMAKGMYAPIVKDNSRFYVGVEFGYARAILSDSLKNQTGAATPLKDPNILIGGPLMGAEYHFQGLPELGFNFEVGYLFNYASAKIDNIGAGDDTINGSLLGILVAFGVHYYF